MRCSWNRVLVLLNTSRCKPAIYFWYRWAATSQVLTTRQCSIVSSRNNVSPSIRLSTMAITLRDETEEDESFLLELYASTRAHEIALVSWTDEQKKTFVAMQ